MKDRYTFRIVVQFYHFSYSHPNLKPLRKGRKTASALRIMLAPFNKHVCMHTPAQNPPRLFTSLWSPTHSSPALVSPAHLRGLTMACSHPTARVLPALQEPTNTFMPNPESHGRKKRAIPRTQLNLSLPLSFLHQQDASGCPQLSSSIVPGSRDHSSTNPPLR